MTIDELIQQGWADHAEKSAEVASRLEAHVDLVQDDPGAAGFMNLAGHVIGDHLGQRERATRLCEHVVRNLGEAAGTASLLQLAVARSLSGDDAGAWAARERLGDEPATDVRIGMLVAQGRMHGGDWAGATGLYTEQLAAADALPPGHAAERACAVVSNNIASEILERAERTPEQAALMERAALAARTYWLRIGTWVNDERADYLLAGVYGALGRDAEARTHAERGLATIAEHGEQKVDEAFLHLARARACRAAGDAEQHAASLARADELAAGFDAEWLTAWFQGERAKSV